MALETKKTGAPRLGAHATSTFTPIQPTLQQMPCLASQTEEGGGKRILVYHSGQVKSVGEKQNTYVNHP